jgi:hypothetical protein
MAVTIRVLGQAAPTAAVETALYTCATTSTVISTLNICNFGAATDTFTVRVNVGGAGDSNEQLLFYLAPLPANTTVTITIGITIAATDVINVTSTNGTSAFSLFGQENA